MEFQREPVLVTPEYRRRVAETLKIARVVASGWFDEIGNFEVVRLDEKTELYNTTSMWALNLLRFNEAEDGVRATKDGFLHVYHGRMTRQRGDRIDPIHTIDPANVRFVDKWDSFRTRVSESGWIFNQPPFYHQQFGDDKIEGQRLEEVLTNAEAGEKPPFYDDHTEFIKIEPGSVGRMVEVVRFWGVNDFVVVDIKDRRLVGRRNTQYLLSRDRWEPMISTSNTQDVQIPS